MGHFYIYKKILIVLLFTFFVSDAAFAQEPPKWINVTSRNKDFPEDKYITGYGQCQRSELDAIKKAENQALERFCKKISIEVIIDGYGESYITEDNSVGDGDVQSDAWSYSKIKVRSYIKEIPGASFESIEDDQNCYAFVYVKRKDLGNYYSNKIKDELNGPVKIGLKMLENAFAQEKQENIDKETKKIKEHLKIVDKNQDVLRRVLLGSGSVMSEDVKKAQDRLNNMESIVNRKKQRSITAKAVVASIFVPGAGHWYKGCEKVYNDKHIRGAGWGFFLGEVAFVGGGVTSYYYSKKELNLMQDPNITFADYQTAKKNYKICRISHLAAFSAAAALYVGNVFSAGFIKPKSGKLCFYPVIISTDNDMASGIGLTYSF